MKIEMRKITQTPKEFSLKSEGLVLKGEISRKASKLFRMDASLSGTLELICDMSGDSFLKEFSDSLVLYISDGLWDMQSQSLKFDDFDVIEFFDGFIDIGYILESEIESIKMDYHTKELR
ncbi:hypothetical protein BKH41_04440 [Helicobacter sp. 12S02232-10]|uniref:hypothetical protein n=1 Tax=Helicobacter sp. 12S02232-10 TaxID=1476197 RepID=UPI000BA55AD1|nr:hypothetical protein [Helicobacter sp. 12S02232-10]PAF48883.1 hypothetical protein BKH41_04440 [Helicobacter sp. 12S02232-10]